MAFDISFLGVSSRGLIQVGVNVAASAGTSGKKNRPSRPRGGPVQPVLQHDSVFCSTLYDRRTAAVSFV